MTEHEGISEASEREKSAAWVKEHKYVLLGRCRQIAKGVSARPSAPLRPTLRASRPFFRRCGGELERAGIDSLQLQSSPYGLAERYGREVRTRRGEWPGCYIVALCTTGRIMRNVTRCPGSKENERTDCGERTVLSDNELIKRVPQHDRNPFQVRRATLRIFNI